MYIFKYCLNLTDDTDYPVFGCPGKDYSADNLSPIDPSKNKGKVCKFS